jgi:hypothetical protein
MSLPSFISDLGLAVGAFVNRHTEAFASGRTTPFPLNSAEGGKEPLHALFEGLSMGSDHQVFNEGSWRIPGLYLHEWPDRYIHTNFDTAAMIDPTKLKRAAFIAAVAGWYLADMSEDQVPAMLALLRGNALLRARDLMNRQAEMAGPDGVAMREVYVEVEQGKLESLMRFVAAPASTFEPARSYIEELANLTLGSREETGASTTATPVYQRNPAIMGPMHAFGYSYLNDHLDPADLAALNLPSDQAYEALNLVNGKRDLREICNWLMAEFGEVDRDAVRTYLEALASIEVIRVKTPVADLSSQ